jgi:c-di-GMP-binding flagellar brake protein YcgR
MIEPQIIILIKVDIQFIMYKKEKTLIKEKRTNKRIEINLPVTYTIFGDHKGTINKGTTYDISDSGICFYTDTHLRVGLTIEIQIPQILDVPRTGTVIWNRVKNSNCWKVGVSFLKG